MSNLYRARATLAEIGAHFGVGELPELRVPHETKPELPGLVIRGAAGRRTIHEMRWGFPLKLADDGTYAPLYKPVNLVAELASPMWEHMVLDPRYRCLIPATQFAEPEGPKGWKTRTWFGVKGWPIFAWAGFCRRTEEWGAVFAGMTTASNESVMPLNDRMPVLLKPEEYDQWLTCPIRDVIGFQFRKFPASLHEIERTDDLWVPRSERGRGGVRATPNTLL